MLLRSQDMSGKVADAILEQKSATTGEERRFEIYNKKFLRVNSRSLRNTKQYDLNLAMMEPWPVRHRKISWRWFAVATILSILSGGIVSYMYAVPGKLDFGLMIPLMAGMIFFTLGAIVMFIYRSPNVMEFRSRYGGCILISLLYKKPNKKTFNTFVQTLKNHILGATQELKVNKQQMLAIELKELRKLASESVIDDTAYSNAKERIFKLHNAS